MESALAFAGYDVAHAWGTHGHDGGPGQVIFPDVMRCLWRDYPQPVKAAVSQNSTLQEITLPGEGWRTIPQDFLGAAGLAANQSGEVYWSDAGSVYRMGTDGKPAIFVFGVRTANERSGPAIAGAAFGPDGTFYAAVPREKRIIAIDPQRRTRTIAEGIAGRGIVVTLTGAIYVTEPGAHSDMPSRIWQIRNGAKSIIDEGLAAASGTAFSPDGGLFFAAEKTSKWIYSFVVPPDGGFRDKQPFYWLHMTDPPTIAAPKISQWTHTAISMPPRAWVFRSATKTAASAPFCRSPRPPDPRAASASAARTSTSFISPMAPASSPAAWKLPGYAPWSKPIAVTSQGAG